MIEPEVQRLADEIARRVLELNERPPSALFLAGGGSKLAGLSGRVADALQMDRKRVAVAGRYFQNSACSDIQDLDDPEYTTPLGIAVSAGLGLISDSYRVVLNGKPAKLFRSGRVTVLELLMMNGFTHSDLLGRSGKSLMLYLDGKRTVFYGEPALPARLAINGVEAKPSQIVHAGDVIQFEPAKAGKDQELNAGQLSRQLGVGGLACQGKLLAPDTPLSTGDSLETVQVSEKGPEKEKAAGAPIQIELNGRPLPLPGKADGTPYYLMDLLERSGIDFKHAERPVRLTVNGADCTFQQRLNDGDRVEIQYE